MRMTDPRYLKLQRSFDRLVGWWLAAEREAKMTETLWWVEQRKTIEGLEAKVQELQDLLARTMIKCNEAHRRIDSLEREMTIDG